ncbi:class I SAM-dependent methyltransferase [Acuticoccus sediminis]|uniref:class I SAM-dependent methyltransferase n=1 Tax=Acuticoccus sediminis TaxID=2184697 RepID=UPI001CFC4C1C|nr:class I SAM-dependent methyltransferase [Acuticoccus sediminis]
MPGRPAEAEEGSASATAKFAADAAATTCAVCCEAGLKPIVDLGLMPRSDGLLVPPLDNIDEQLVPLRVGFCPNCATVQLLETRPAEEMFGDEYFYFSSYSDHLLRHSSDHAEELIERFDLGPDTLVLEIASNDGYMLANFQRQGIPVLGVDPAPHPAEAAIAKGIDTRVDFFTTTLAETLKGEGIRPRVIIANNVVAHVAEQNDLVKAMATVLDDDGVVVVEFPYVRDLVEHCEFDTIYHEHRCYFSIRSAKTLFERAGLYLVDVKRVPIHGGSLRLTFAKTELAGDAVEQALSEEDAAGVNTYAYYETFAARVRAFRKAARQLVGSLLEEGKSIAAYGAAAKGTIMLNYLGLGDRVIAYACDRNPHKQGKLMPGVHVPIADPARLLEDRPDAVIILPWNFADEIIGQQTAYLRAGGQFIVPIPELRVVDADSLDRAEARVAAE